MVCGATVSYACGPSSRTACGRATFSGGQRMSRPATSAPLQQTAFGLSDGGLVRPLSARCASDGTSAAPRGACVGQPVGARQLVDPGRRDPQHQRHRRAGEPHVAVIRRRDALDLPLRPPRLRRYLGRAPRAVPRPTPRPRPARATAPRAATPCDVRAGPHAPRRAPWSSCSPRSPRPPPTTPSSGRTPCADARSSRRSGCRRQGHGAPGASTLHGRYRPRCQHDVPPGTASASVPTHRQGPTGPHTATICAWAHLDQPDGSRGDP